ncbi:hypothetical protein Golomagni_02429 [Golovinomyces magnicellulatus]|nr:hypothetical protein Golomagni_02429 [Golovinomyces magnicellulatus]
MVLCHFTVLMCLLTLTSKSDAKPTLLRRQDRFLKDEGSLPAFYDVIIVGGGPAGLSALSSLARVRREVLLIDSGDYRNTQTRNSHDVIGSDGISPSLFRKKAREQIARYPTVFIQNETVISISRSHNGSTFVTTISRGRQYTSRKIVLATGIKDILPNTPGIDVAWGGGIYWCTWCDGWEHRDQPLGILVSLPDVIDRVLQVKNLNNDIIAFVNGSDTPANREILDGTSPGWQNSLARLGVTLENRTITGIERLQDGSIIKNETTWEEFDKFHVTLEDGTQIQRGALLMSFPKRQHSYLGEKLGVRLENERIVVNRSNMRAAPGVWGVGDANNDGTTNVPHALYTGKKAGVNAHFELAREEIALFSANKRSESERVKGVDDSLELLWYSLT